MNENVITVTQSETVQPLTMAARVQLSLEIKQKYFRFLPPAAEWSSHLQLSLCTQEMLSFLDVPACYQGKLSEFSMSYYFHIIQLHTPSKRVGLITVADPAFYKRRCPQYPVLSSRSCKFDISNKNLSVILGPYIHILCMILERSESIGDYFSFPFILIFRSFSPIVFSRKLGRRVARPPPPFLDPIYAY